MEMKGNLIRVIRSIYSSEHNAHTFVKPPRLHWLLQILHGLGNHGSIVY